MRIGIFGGTFDPVHYGHLLLAECCRESCALDRVLLIPAASPPHKQDRTPAPAAHRIAMLELAVGGHRAFEVSTIEIDRGGVSYTVQTLQAVAQSWPEAAFFLLMGSDSLADLPSWREPSRICELSTPVVVHRAGEAAADFHGLAELLPADRITEIAAMQVQMPRIDLSSTDLRTRVAAGRSIRFRTPRAVEMYIQTTGLYRKLPADAVGGPGAG